MIITLNEVKGFNPCYNPQKYGKSRAKLTTVLRMGEIPRKDRVWLACQVIARRDRPLLVEFAKWCASRAYAAVDAADAAAADAAERQKQINWLIEKLENTTIQQ